MAVGTVEPIENAGNASAADRIADAIRQAAHFSHKARMVASIARDAGDEGIYAAKRAARRAQRGVDVLEDLADDAARYVKHRPFRALAIAAGVGLAIGVLVGWIGGGSGTHQGRPSSPVA